MGSKLKDRSYQMLIVITVVFFILIIRLFALTVIQGEEWRNASDNIRVKEIYTPAPRGEIMDRYGRVLAGNIPNFVVQIVRNEVIDEDINKMAITLLSILEENGDHLSRDFPIKIVDGQFVYSYDLTIQKWLQDQELPIEFSAQEAFDAIRERYRIDESLDKYDAQIELQTRYQEYPIISVKNMAYLPTLEKNTFLGRYNLEKEYSAQEAFEAFKESFSIESNYSNADALKIMIIRNELVSQGYTKYRPVKIASGVSDQTIITIEEQKEDLAGIEVVVEPIREYPYNNLSSHLLGYLGKITESEKQSYLEENGYLNSDLVGKDGIEKAFEDVLKGKTGIKNVEVDALGRLIKEIEEAAPQKGGNVYLTIDVDLQEVATEALGRALEEIQIGGTFESQWGDYNFFRGYPNAKTGAVVAVDVKTGEILAMVSLPDYDPNLFTQGISEEDWESLQDKNPRDSLSPTPLYNIVARTAVQPGSTFKMITGLTAIEKGFDPYTRLIDGGVIELGSRTFACHVWNNYRSNHGAINLMKALEVSCNYIFYDLINDYDFYLDRPLNIGITATDVMDMAKKFGLDQKTGVEITETITGVPDEGQKLESTKALLRRMIINDAETYFGFDVSINQELLEPKIESIVGWVEENPTRNELVKRLQELEVNPDEIFVFADLIKYSYYNMAQWSTGDRFNLAIGQGDHAYTVLQMARYISAIANDGVLNELTLVKEVDGIELPEKNKEIIEFENDENLAYIQQGMRQVVTGSLGSFTQIFSNFPVPVAGKSGTAEKHGKIQPKDEVEYIRENLSKINYRLEFEDVEQEMIRLMAENPEKYNTRSFAIRQAVINLSDGRVDMAMLDIYKEDYTDFGWCVTYAPYDDPEIAVVAVVIQGNHGNYAAPVAREILAEYLGLYEKYDNINIDNSLLE